MSPFTAATSPLASYQIQQVYNSCYGLLIMAVLPFSAESHRATRVFLLQLCIFLGRITALPFCLHGFSEPKIFLKVLFSLSYVGQFFQWFFFSLNQSYQIIYEFCFFFPRLFHFQSSASLCFKLLSSLARWLLSWEVSCENLVLWSLIFLFLDFCLFFSGTHSHAAKKRDMGDTF